MARKLKVYRTPIGFHDAYVAAPSQKAALAAWGTTTNLFARGVAEEVTDTKLTKAPLATPGEVVKVARGSADEHPAALPKTKIKPATKPKAKARPNREPLKRAEAALASAETDFEREDKALARREQALAKERATFDRQRKEKLAELAEARDDADDCYRRALADWQP